jgi:hypothetical protein
MVSNLKTTWLLLFKDTKYKQNDTELINTFLWAELRVIGYYVVW